MDINNRKICEGSIMIKDLDLLKDIAPLFKKKIVIWGVGYIGRLILKELKAMGAGNKGIYLVIHMEAGDKMKLKKRFYCQKC